MAPRQSEAGRHAGFEVGDLVWTPCPQNGFRRCSIVSLEGENLLVEYRDDQDPSQNGQFLIRRSEIRPYYDSGADRTFEDNTAMPHLDDANILDNMRRRFAKDHIYTYTANVLLAVNPYKSMKFLYTAEQMAIYRGQNPGKLPPHPYAIADIAYRHMLRERQNQALVISGESGAGKTETAKLTMHYLTSISRTDQAHGGRIQDKIIHANPILESFGNASTVRNMNSSRFGKYNEMCFNRVGSLVGAGIQTFLLECSRVVSQQSGERNYHVFYELLAGLDKESIARLKLKQTGSYRLLHGGGAKPLEYGSEELKRLAGQFQELKDALALFTEGEEQRCDKEIWDIVAALIHLGEVDFAEIPASDAPKEEGSEPAKIDVAAESKEALTQAAELLGLPAARVEQVLKWREMRVRQADRMTKINCPRTQPQAINTLQCIVKILYKRLFDAIVERINYGSKGGIFGSPKKGHDPKNFNSIGTLDIYGFERLNTNSFEQLCINLANERLQQFFVEEVLEAEQRTYAEESLNIGQMQLPDCGPVVSGIQAIMSILDEYSLRSIKNLLGPGEDKDIRFCEAVHRSQIQDNKGPVMKLKMKASRSAAGPGQNDGFQIRHYAGDVPYSTRGWIEKNNDALVPEVEALLSDSSKTLVKDLADSTMDAGGGEKLHSVSTHYLTNLNILLQTLKTCTVHYIRCFNPNSHRKAGEFDAKYVLDQVIQCGTVELVRIMHDGFPNRCVLRDLRDRFQSMLPAVFSHYSDRDFVHAVMLAFEIDESQWTLGTKRLFLKAGQLRVLENLRDCGSGANQDIIRRIRVLFVRKKVRAWVHAISILRWLPSYIKRQRLASVIRDVKKACFIHVRLHRWLKKARATLYGIEETEDPALEDLKLYQHGLVHNLETRWQIANKHGVKVNYASPEMFVALNTEQLPQYSSYLENQVDVGHTVHDSVLRLTQDNMSESVLYFTGRAVLSAKLNPRPFVKNRGSSRAVGGYLAGEASISGKALEDLRQVDVHESAMALPCGESRAFKGETIAMCQHQKNKQVFATCDTENRILVWRWKGTESEDPSKHAVKPLCTIPGSRRETVLKISFLSEVPQRIIDNGGHVLLKVSLPHGQNWLYISAIAVYSGAFKTESVTEVLFFEPLLDGIRKTGVDINIFKMAHSERMFVIGGTGILQFWSIRDSPEGLRLSCAVDLLETFSKIRTRTFPTCLCLPAPVNSIRKPGVNDSQDADSMISITDWVVLGDSKGQLFGFAVNCTEPGKAELIEGQSGRFRGCKHTEGVPIASVFASYGDRPESHYVDIQRRGLSYTQYLRNPPVDKTSVCSLGVDGKLMLWKFGEEGWALAQDKTVLKPGGHDGAFCPVAAQGSMLVPNAMIFADETRRQLAAIDRIDGDTVADQGWCSWS